MLAGAANTEMAPAGDNDAAARLMPVDSCATIDALAIVTTANASAVFIVAAEQAPLRAFAIHTAPTAKSARQPVAAMQPVARATCVESATPHLVKELDEAESITCALRPAAEQVAPSDSTATAICVERTGLDPVREVAELTSADAPVVRSAFATVRVEALASKAICVTTTVTLDVVATELADRIAPLLPPGDEPGGTP